MTPWVGEIPKLKVACSKPAYPVTFKSAADQENNERENLTVDFSAAGRQYKRDGSSGSPFTMYCIIKHRVAREPQLAVWNFGPLYHVSMTEACLEIRTSAWRKTLKRCSSGVE
jgi:hypothetical protein